MNARRRCSRLGCLALALILPRGAAAEFRTADVEGLKIVFDSDWGTHTAPGYVPVRFDITNLGDARVIEIAGDVMRFARASGPLTLHIGQAVRLARGDRVRLTIPVPVFAPSESFRFEIRENGKVLQGFNYTGVESATPMSAAAALIVADTSTAYGKLAADWPRPVTMTTARSLSFAAAGSVISSTGTSIPRTSPSPPHLPPLDVVMEPSRLPDNWLGYASLRAVVVGANEWSQLDDAQKGALLTWTACGGDLILVDGAAEPMSGGGHHTPAASAAAPARAYFFGRIHRRTSDAIAEKGLAGVLGETAVLRDSDWALPVNSSVRWASIGARGFRLPIPGVNGVPTRAYLSILIAFSVLIGPVNYWLLKRRRQQVLFVLTAPLVAALFIALLVGYVFVADGFGVTGRAQTITFLDQSRKQAATRASTSLYAAGMTPAGGLSFPRDVAVYALGPDGEGSRDSQDIDLTDSQRFASGVIHARAPTNVESIAFRPARERLTFTPSAGGMSVENGLGVTIERLRYRSGGRVYVLNGPLPAGATATLTPGRPDARGFVPADLPHSSRFIDLTERQPEGSYLAVLERSPFWEPGVRGVIERGSFHLVIGWPDGQP